jgi:DNA-binding transcriptional ArsR family regulator
VSTTSTEAERQAALEAVLAALAHAARRQILLTIWFRGGRVRSSEIAKRFAHAWPTTTRHLRVLESAGLLTHDVAGKNHFYRINKDKLAVLHEWLAWFETAPLETPPASEPPPSPA